MLLKRELPLPGHDISSDEIKEATIKLAAAFRALEISYGIIGGSAIQQHAQFYHLPQRLIAEIDVIIQPSYKTDPPITASTVSDDLCSGAYLRNDFGVKTPLGKKQPRIIVFRDGNPIFIEVNIYDHLSSPERKPYYDLSLRKNKRVIVGSVGKTIHVLDAQWLLRQEIFSQDEQRTSWNTRNDLSDILTLCDVLHRKNEKLSVGGEREIAVLAAFAEQFRKKNDIEVLLRVVDCSAIFGPWYRRRRGRCFFVIGIIILLLPLCHEFLEAMVVEDTSSDHNGSMTGPPTERKYFTWKKKPFIIQQVQVPAEEWIEVADAILNDPTKDLIIFVPDNCLLA